MKQALGMIEVRGLSTGILIADTMAKTANIQIYDIENTKGLGYMTVKVVGDVGAVNSAISAAKQEAIEYGKYISSTVIPRPNDFIYDTFLKDISSYEKTKDDREKEDVKSVEIIEEKIEETTMKEEMVEKEELETEKEETSDTTVKDEETEEIIEEKIEKIEIEETSDDKEENTKSTLKNTNNKKNKKKK
ncbi:MAG: BMC domain-containing protein [Peptoanaerobacter stomatis]|uniref:BMC domain-containing protein n=1 Tax=Peptoanaerobacter stomatis TaxID=796937 RepID=UPI003FA1378C